MNADGPDRRVHRPTLRADLTALIDATGGEPATSVAERAVATAYAVVSAGRQRHGELPPAELVRLADIVGIDTLAQLWRDADPVSLPGALWALYLLRHWCHAQPEQVADFWRAGAPLAPAEAVVAGVPDAPDPADVTRLADAIVAGVFEGDVAVAFERGAALFRVLAAGRRDHAAGATGGAYDASGDRGGNAGDAAGDPELERALRNDRVAADLTVTAARWREGRLY